MQLFLALTIAVWSNLQSCAEEGLAFPDSAGVSFQKYVTNDTVLVTINNLTSDVIENFFLTDFTDSTVTEIECLADSTPCESLLTENNFGDVYFDKFTTRWVVGSFHNNVQIKYFSRYYMSDRLNWSAGHPFPIYGTMPAGHNIGPPRNVHWTE